MSCKTGRFQRRLAVCERTSKIILTWTRNRLPDSFAEISRSFPMMAKLVFTGRLTVTIDTAVVALRNDLTSSFLTTPGLVRILI